MLDLDSFLIKSFSGLDLSYELLNIEFYCVADLMIHGSSIVKCSITFFCDDQHF